MHATLSFDGLLIGYPTLFDGLQVPKEVDKDTVVEYLLSETMELEVMISSGPVMARALAAYSAVMLPSWTRYAKALGLEYNPLDTDERTRTLEHSGEDSNTRSPNLITETTSTGESTRKPNLTTTGQNNGEDSTTREVMGFDSAQLQTAEKNTTQLGTGNTITSTGTDSTSTTDSQTVKNTGSDSTQGTTKYTDTETYQGRAGKSAQSLVLSELAVAYENAVARIVDDIKQKFCLLVY